jgi:hypothetical protein
MTFTAGSARQCPQKQTSLSNLEAALPAAPAAVRLIVTAFRTCSRLQQLAGMEGSSAIVQLVAADAAFQDAFAATLGRMLSQHS